MSAQAVFARIKSFQDGPVLDSIIKAHVKEEPGKSTGLWKTDIEDVIENFNGFLCAVAAQKKRLSSRMLCRRLTKFFKTDHVTLEDFAGKLAQALRYCYFKGKKFTSGKKNQPCSSQSDCSLCTTQAEWCSLLQLSTHGGLGLKWRQ